MNEFTPCRADTDAVKSAVICLHVQSTDGSSLTAKEPQKRQHYLHMGLCHELHLRWRKVAHIPEKICRILDHRYAGSNSPVRQQEMEEAQLWLVDIPQERLTTLSYWWTAGDSDNIILLTGDWREYLNNLFSAKWMIEEKGLVLHVWLRYI